MENLAEIKWINLVVRALDGILISPVASARNNHSTHTNRLAYTTIRSAIKVLLTGLFFILTLGNSLGAPVGHEGKSGNNWGQASVQTGLDSVTRLLRLKLYLDQYDYDDIVIGFNAGASTTYNPNDDSSYLPGIGAAEGLASYSSDGVALSVNLLPLPALAPDIIRLDVQATNSWTFTLKRTELDSIPKMYSIWLVDNYKKDSVDLRVDSNYVFNINKADTATFGSYRFYVVVRRNAPQPFQLIGFNALKAADGVQTSWITKNEGGHTNFCLQRAVAGDSTFKSIDSLTSDSAGAYSFTDHHPPAGSITYRLKAIDCTNTITYSNKITLFYTNTSNIAGGISVYPNPTSSTLNLSINVNGENSAANSPTITAVPVYRVRTAGELNSNDVYNIKIINITGSVVKASTSASDNWQNDVSDLRPGTYVVQVVNNKDGSIVGRSTFIKM